MPCEGCNVQFTVFRRKRSCADCKRFYCSNCLSGSRRSSSTHSIVRCERCKVFAKRPLLRSDLLLLKPKDLIFYLQSKHISTAGCVEKDELVRLVLHHVQHTEAANASSNANSPSAGADTTHSFDNLKQTCQNFFSSITENISESLGSFDSNKTAKSNHNYNQHPSGSSVQTHIYDQPRVSTREMPTYASSQQNNYFQPMSPPNSCAEQRTVLTQRNLTTELATEDRPISSISGTSRSTGSNTQNSQTTSTSSTSSNRNTGNESGQVNCTVAQASDTHNHRRDDNSDCECSDEELITTFSERNSNKSENYTQINHTTNCTDNATATTVLIPEEDCASGAKLEIFCEADESSQSSFEELGAIGGISDDSKAATDTNSSNMEQWQILDNQRLTTNSTELPTGNDVVPEKPELEEKVPTDNSQLPKVPQRTKKVTRRRSDTYLNRRPASDEDVQTNAGIAEENLFDVPKQRASCKRCGKNKSNIKNHVEKMRRHLESALMSEDDIKRELKEFLAYVEMRTKSIDLSDSETATSPVSVGTSGAEINVSQFLQDILEAPHLSNNHENSNYNGVNNSRFVNLDDYDTLKELECLSVKQLKEVLMLHRVDYKGCCEKQELLDRVERLWKNLKSTPTVDKLPTDELCKICMDAPIECVILECGHMATCTNCGKVLSECPICRQYIVRVVRFFRA